MARRANILSWVNNAREIKGLDKDPKCVKCGSKMRFSCTELEKPGFAHHVYECIKCRSTQSFVTPL